MTDFSNVLNESLNEQSPSMSFSYSCSCILLIVLQKYLYPYISSSKSLFIIQNEKYCKWKTWFKLLLFSYVQAIFFTLEEGFIYPYGKASFPWKSTKYVPDRGKKRNYKNTFFFFLG